jgi:hypothetical protein
MSNIIGRYSGIRSTVYMKMGAGGWWRVERHGCRDFPKI